MIAGLLGLLILVGRAASADKELKGKLDLVYVKKMQLVAIVEDKKVTFDVNAETKFVGPKGGVSEMGIKDDRLVKGAELKLVVAGNNRTLREVHLPERKAKDQDK
jgi:hypothetical protein